MKKHSTLLTAMAALMALTVSAQADDSCTPAHEIETIEPGKLQVAATTYRPASWLNGSTLMGVDGEILKEIAAMECLEAKGIPVEAAAGLNYITRGRADAADGGWYRTAEREKILTFSDPVYLDQMAAVSHTRLTDITEMQGMTVGTVQGNLWVSELKEIFGRNLKLYPNLNAVQMDLANGRIDAYFESYSVAANAANAGHLDGFEFAAVSPDERVSASMEPSQVGFPMRQENPQLIEAINADLAVLRKNGRIAEILSQHGLSPAAADVGAPRLIE